MLFWYIPKKTKILVDCGISGKVAESGIRKIGIEPSEISAILVTHEHNDPYKRCRSNDKKI